MILSNLSIHIAWGPVYPTLSLERKERKLRGKERLIPLMEDEPHKWEFWLPL